MTDQLNAGVELMLIGMGIVFVFLAMLIVAVNLMSAIVLRFFPQVTVASPAPKSGASDDPRVIAAITAAVRKHRSKHK